MMKTDNRTDIQYDDIKHSCGILNKVRLDSGFANSQSQTPNPEKLPYENEKRFHFCNHLMRFSSLAKKKEKKRKSGDLI